MDNKPAIRVIRMSPSYWYAEVKSEQGWLDGRGGFESEAGAMAWAREAQNRSYDRFAVRDARTLIQPRG